MLNVGRNKFISTRHDAREQSANADFMNMSSDEAFAQSFSIVNDILTISQSSLTRAYTNRDNWHISHLPSVEVLPTYICTLDSDAQVYGPQASVIVCSASISSVHQSWMHVEPRSHIA